MKKMLELAEAPSMRTEQEEALPKKGAICVQWTRCRRSGCRCARGELHGPYYYLFWREGGRLRKRYVRLAEVAGLRVACDARRDGERRAREAARAARQEWRELLALIREVERDG